MLDLSRGAVSLYTLTVIQKRPGLGTENVSPRGVLAPKKVTANIQMLKVTSNRLENLSASWDPSSKVLLTRLCTCDGVQSSRVDTNVSQ